MQLAQCDSHTLLQHWCLEGSYCCKDIACSKILKSILAAVFQPDLCKSCMQAKVTETPSLFMMQPRGCIRGLSLVERLDLLHRSLGISTQHQDCSSDSHHSKSSCIASIQRLLDIKQFGEVHRID